MMRKPVVFGWFVWRRWCVGLGFLGSLVCLFANDGVGLGLLGSLVSLFANDCVDLEQLGSLVSLFANDGVGLELFKNLVCLFTNHGTVYWNPDRCGRIIQENRLDFHFVE